MLFRSAALATAADSVSTKCPYPDALVPGFQPAMKEFMVECRTLSKLLLRLLGLCLGLNDPDSFLATHSNP